MEKSTSNFNYGYQNEPSDQRIPSREHNYQEEPSEERIISRQNSGFEGRSQLTSNQQPTQMQYLGPGQYYGPQVHYVPGRQVNIVPINDQAIPQPGGQYMVRDTTTPMPDDSYDPMMLRCVYSLRVISAVCIFLDICLSWIQVSALKGSTEVPGWLDFLEIFNSLKESSPAPTKCIQGLQRLRSTYTAFCAIATVYGLVRIVNIVGETIIEYNKQRPSENEPQFRGFQIIHGWLETVLALVCDDIPQVLVFLSFSLWCKLELIVAAKMFAWFLIKTFKNNGRFDSCKHHYKFKCKCEFKQNHSEKCCVFSANFCCKIFYFRPCPSSDQQCYETKSFDIWPDINCMREGRCCGEIHQDPEWARNLYFKLSKLFLVLFIAMLILTVVKHFTRVLDLP